MLIRGSSSVFRCWIRFRRSRRVSTVFRSPSGCSMTFVGPLTVIWPSYQNAVVGGKCSWRFSPIIAASRPWSSPLLLSRVSPHLLFCFHNSTTYPFEVAAWDVEKLDIFGRHIRTSITSVTTIDPLSAKMKCHSTEFPWNADYLDAILRISRVLAFLAILILLLSLNNENALLQTHSKFTHQHHVRTE